MIHGRRCGASVSEFKAGDIEVTALGNGRYQVTGRANHRLAFAIHGSKTWVFLEGRSYAISEHAPGPSRARADALEGLTAPMPATVLAIHVALGDRVQRNDVLLILEAMKMELPIRSPRDGVVTRIACAVEELVQPGEALIELE